MTNAQQSTRTTVEHLFIVPSGSDAKDLDIAMHWARARAKDLGQSTDYDDWMKITVEGENVVLVVTEVQKQ